MIQCKGGLLLSEWRETFSDRTGAVKLLLPDLLPSKYVLLPILCLSSLQFALPAFALDNRYSSCILCQTCICAKIVSVTNRLPSLAYKCNVEDACAHVGTSAYQ